MNTLYASRWQLFGNLYAFQCTRHNFLFENKTNFSSKHSAFHRCDDVLFATQVLNVCAAECHESPKVSQARTDWDGKYVNARFEKVHLSSSLTPFPPHPYKMNALTCVCAARNGKKFNEIRSRSSRAFPVF